MKSAKHILYSFSALFAFLKIAGSPVDSTRFEIVFRKNDIKQAGINEKLINKIQFGPNGLYILATPTQFYAAAGDTIIQLGKKNWGSISSFAFTNEGLLMGIRNNELCFVDSTGRLKKIHSLPAQGMGITGGKYAMYIYDQTGNKTVNGVYALLHGGNYKLLFKVDRPIESLAEANGKLYYSYLNSILCYDIETNKTECILKLENTNDKIISIAVDKNSEVVYFSTQNWIACFKDNNTQVISKSSGGILDMTSGAITVFNPNNNYLIRIVGYKFMPVSSDNESQNKNTSAPTTTANITLPVKENPEQTNASPNNTNTSGSSEILYNESIIKLVKAKLSDDVIIELIKSREVDFNLSVDSLVSLSEKGVSSSVIKEMKAAIERKNKK